MKRSKLEKYVENYVIEYKEVIYRLAYSYVKKPDDALDIVQESIYKAFSSIDCLKEPKFIKTWFYRIVVNTSLDFIKKRKREVLVDKDFLINNEVAHTDIYSDIDLEKALDDLPYDYRTIIVLRYFEDLKISEIAEILDENINTVKTKLYTGLRKLKINVNIDSQEA